MNVSPHGTTAQTVDQLHNELSKVGIVPLEEKLPKERPVRELRRSRRLASDDSVAMMTLVEIDSVTYWRQGLAASGTPGRRSGSGFITLFGGQPITTVKLERLGINQIASFLKDLDEKQFASEEVEKERPNTSRQWPALREWKNGKLVPTDKVAATGRLLILVHGTFSNNDALFRELQATPEGQEFLTDLLRTGPDGAASYTQVLTFDHHTVSVSPVLNALELARIVAHSSADIDVICHSRGGLVTRWFLEVFDRPERKTRAVIVGAPLRGTSLAAPDRLRNSIDLCTNIGKVLGGALTLIPFTKVAGSLLKIACSVGSLTAKVPLMDATIAMIPGLAAMSRIDPNFELDALRNAPSKPIEYFAVTSDYAPPAVNGWKFWEVFCNPAQHAAAAVDAIIFRDSNGIPCPNDLVVDTTSMTEYGFPSTIAPNSLCRFQPSDHVFHTSYFQNRRTIQFIRHSLGI